MWNLIRKLICLKTPRIAACVFCAYLFFLVILTSLTSTKHPTRQSNINTSSNEVNLLEKQEYLLTQHSNNFQKFTSHPWIKDPLCQEFTVQLSKRDSLPKWALASFPGSGVTWTRQMIEGITGIYTGSMHDQDPAPVQADGIKKLGVTDDPFCGCTIIDKDHEATLTTLGMADYFRLLHVEGYSKIYKEVYGNRGVILLRNPMDVVFTFRHWQFAGKTGQAPRENFTGQDWDKVVDYVAFAWADHAIRWIEETKKGTVLFYEQLLGQNATLELERFWRVMEFKEPMNPDRLRCTLAHRNRMDHRRVNKTRIPLKEDQRLGFMKSIHRVQQSLRRRNWPLLPVHLYDLHGL